MKKIELYFQKFDFEKSFNENKIKLAEFTNVDELKKSYLDYFDDENIIEDWEIKDFDTSIRELDKLNLDNGIILAINTLAVKIYGVKNMDGFEKNPLYDLFKNVEAPPMLLCAGYCN
ncbi:hypothetical protein [Flavobacterium sp. H122]|uniref:hypothetical protein n=1 Tax=Flavobacterium sp. H122 TaxID=2529860 RepID=UPI0010AA46B6|nr:hypothetical protein [Flavobacterium sp. H122]